MYDWHNMSEKEKIEAMGFFYFNRVGEDDWVSSDTFYNYHHYSIQEDNNGEND